MVDKFLLAQLQFAPILKCLLGGLEQVAFSGYGYWFWFRH